MLTEEAKSEIDVLFPPGLTASHAYSDFVRSLGHKSEDDLQFYINKSDRSKCPKGNSIFCMPNTVWINWREKWYRNVR